MKPLFTLAIESTRRSGGDWDMSYFRCVRWLLYPGPLTWFNTLIRLLGSAVDAEE